jgi:hypothetical protein
MESGQQVHTSGQGSSSNVRPTPGSSKKRVHGSRPSSPILRSGGVKEESPEPELDEVSLLISTLVIIISVRFLMLIG